MRTALPLSTDRSRSPEIDGGMLRISAVSSAAHLHGEAAVLDVAGDLAGAADADQLAHEDVTLQLATHIGAIDLHLAEAAAAWLHDEQVAGDVAFDVAEHLDAAAVADFALEEGVFSDDEDARLVFH